MSMGALDGIRVLDLTHAHAGPICTMFMGAMGAEVIKIEPIWGEMTRMFPPLIKGVSPYFMFVDRCKKGVTLNLKSPKGLEMFKELVKKSDVVIENFSPGTVDDLGLGWETLKELNPKIVFASISGFGQTGPWTDRRSFDPIAQAASGYMWLMKDSIDPNGPPHQAPDAIADTIPGFEALIGILSALISRNVTGKGQRIDVAQMDAMVGVFQSYSFWSLTKMTFKKAVESYGVRVSGCHKAKDGYIMFSLPPGRITEWFKELVGAEELTWEGVAKWVESKTVKEVDELLAKAGIPVAPVLNLDDVMANEQAKAREMFVKVNHPVLGEVTLPGFPIKFSETRGDITKPSPLLGQHNAEIYGGLLGMSDKELDDLKNEGVI